MPRKSKSIDTRIIDYLTTNNTSFTSLDIGIGIKLYPIKDLYKKLDDNSKAYRSVASRSKYDNNSNYVLQLQNQPYIRKDKKKLLYKAITSLILHNKIQLEEINGVKKYKLKQQQPVIINNDNDDNECPICYCNDVDDRSLRCCGGKICLGCIDACCSKERFHFSPNENTFTCPFCRGKTETLYALNKDITTIPDIPLENILV